MNALLYEILGERYYTLQPSFFGVARNNLFKFLSTRDAAHVEHNHKLQSFAHFVDGKLTTSHAKLVDFRKASADGEEPRGGVSADPESKVINIVNLFGPMTRNGGACSLGSIEMRDTLIEAADCDNVIGHIIYTQTPGGMASTLMDFRKAIDYIHDKGQKIYMFCDGTVASGGAFLSAMCDGVYAYNGDDEIGSIGMYGAFFTLANGAVNSITQEKYVEYYAEKSTEKNIISRAAAEDNIEPLKKDVDEYLDELLAQMKSDRPSIKEEQMNGAMFRMKDVIGTIIDGLSTLPELCQKIYDDWAAEQKDDTPKGNTNSNSKQSMSKEYTSIARGVGYADGEKIVSDNDGILSLQPAEADALETLLADMTEKINTSTTEADAMRKEITSLTASVSSLNASVAGLVVERDALKSELESANKQEEMVAEREAQAKRIAELEEMLSGLTQKVTDLTAELAEARSGENDNINAGAAPDGNGAAAGAAKMESNVPTYDSSLSPAENAARLQNYLKAQKAKV
jgi:ClpP class serine protease